MMRDGRQGEAVADGAAEAEYGHEEEGHQHLHPGNDPDCCVMQWPLVTRLDITSVGDVCHVVHFEIGHDAHYESG